MLERNHALCEWNEREYGSVIAGLIEGPCSHYEVAVSHKNELVLHMRHSAVKHSHTEEVPRFQVGSVTKAITGALIVKLIELGVLTLYDPVGKFIPEWKSFDVEMIHLLTHTTGFDEAFGQQHEWPKRGQRESYYERLCSRAEPKFQTGTVNRYFTANYAMLTRILESVTGMTLESFAQDMLFGPLGMTYTTFEWEKVRDAFVIPLNGQSGEPEKRLTELDITGDSGLFTTASDLLAFGQMILNDGVVGGRQVFSKSAIDLMKRDLTGGKFGRTVNFWLKTELDKHGMSNIDIHRCFSDFHSSLALGHNGFTGCWLYIDPLYDTAGVILTNSMKMNTDGRYYKRIGNVLMSMLER
ncbi:serine hydrolase [Paenibacillus sp. HB172176]|uniref:serine hydrolase domain-containing protein n=1 Tax=Paenibacillus sp. HB172176 TaxID=2493690 RepID=UPI00143A34B8|nr:serine hydrolase [Paenibacillus sp. HB172176]